jgi:hypothetical protein
VDSGSFFNWAYSDWDESLTTHIHLVAKLRINGAISRKPVVLFGVCTDDNNL